MAARLGKLKQKKIYVLFIVEPQDKQHLCGFDREFFFVIPPSLATKYEFKYIEIGL